MATEYEDFARTEAQRRGIDGDTSVKVWKSEGGLTEPARRGTFPSGSSWWAPQLHYGGRGYEYLGTTAGMGNGFTALTGWQPGDPAAWKDAMRYALDHVKVYGWGAWHGATAQGITGFKGVDVNFHWGGTPDSEWDWKNRMATVTYDDYRDPQPAGRFTTMPKGVILHGSRSGVAGNPKAKEYAGTANWEVNNPDGLGWHVTLGMNRVALHLTPQEWGWHALQASKVYLGVEFAQATVNEPIADEQVAAFADWFKRYVLPAWPNIPLHFPSHAEADREFNQNQGKTDAFPLGDPRMDDLRARIMAALGGTVPAPNPYSVGPGILAAMTAHADDPATDEIFIKAGGKDAYSEAYGTSGARYVYLPATNRTHRYDPAA